MLIYQLGGQGGTTSINSNSLHASFSQEYENLGYPAQGGIRNIAISNGSECGTSLDFEPYAQLVLVDETIDLPFLITNGVLGLVNYLSLNPIKFLTSVFSTDTDIKVKFDLRALPNQQSQQIYRGRIYIKKKVLSFINAEEPLISEKTINATATMLPLDNAAGGIYDINQFADLPPDISEFMFEQRFSFIPTYSSLDIGGGSQTITGGELTRIYSPIAPPSSPKNIPFHNFFTNPTISENHIQFTLNNGQWLLTELQGTPAFYSCASSCSNPPQMSINGDFPPGSCSSSTRTFSVSNPGIGINYEWSVSSGLEIVGTNIGNSVSIRVEGNGNQWINVSTETECDEVDLASKTVSIATPQLSVSTSDDRSPQPSNYTYHTATVQQLPNTIPSNYKWYNEGAGALPTTLITTGLQLNSWPIPPCTTKFYQLRVITNCGTAVYRGYAYNGYGCGGPNGFMAYPNPANNEITIVQEPQQVDADQVENTAETKIIEEEFTANLYNQFNEVLKKANSKDSQITFDVKDLPVGIYYLHIHNSEEIIRSQIVIER